MERFFTIIAQANTALQADDLAASGQLWETLRREYPHDSAGYLGGLTACRRSNDAMGAAQMVIDAYGRFPLHPVFMTEMALLFCGTENYATAFDLFSGIDPDFASAEYFKLATKLWHHFFDRNEPHKTDTSFRQAVKAPPAMWEAYLPEFIRITQKTRGANEALYNRYIAYFGTMIGQMDKLTDAAELAVLIYDIPTPLDNRGMLVYKWSLHPNLDTLFSVFEDTRKFPYLGGRQTFQNGGFLNNIARMLIENRTVDALTPVQQYNYAVLLSVIDRTTYRDFLAAIFNKPAQDGRNDPTSPKGVLFKIYQQLVFKPPAVPPPRRLRIALCVSGQLRGFKRAVPTWAKLGLDRHHVDTFVHTWQVVGRRRPDSDQGIRCFHDGMRRAYEQAYRSHGEAGMIARYPALMAFLHNPQETTTVEELADVFHTRNIVLEDDRLPPYNGFPHPQKMYSKIESCHGLAVASGQDYDLVIRLRPDKEVKSGPQIDWHEIYQRSVDQHLIYADRPQVIHWVPPLGLFVGDQFAVGAAPLMAQYSRAYSATVDAIYNNTYGFPKYFFGHTNASFNGFFNGIAYDLLPGLEFGELMDPEHIDPQLLLSLLQQDMGGQPRDDQDQTFLNACGRDADALSNS